MRNYTVCYILEKTFKGDTCECNYIFFFRFVSIKIPNCIIKVRYKRCGIYCEKYFFIVKLLKPKTLHLKDQSKHCMVYSLHF